MSITEYRSGEMGGPKFIATCGDQRMSIYLFKRMTVVRRASCEAGSHHGEKLSVSRAMSGLGSGTVSQLQVGRGETRDHPTRSP